jgi:hypothetical protein
MWQMPRNNDMGGEGLPPEVFKKALLLACQRIAESSQLYEEINTAEGWYEVFVKHATAEHQTPAAKT